MQVQSSLKSRGSNLAGLDLLRLMAALIVMLYHYFYWNMRDAVYARNFTGTWIERYSSSFHSGWVGVEIFFVISGVVIYKSASHSNARRFFTGRILRLVPAVWICAPISILLGLSLATLDMHSLWSPLFRGLLFSPQGPWPEGAYWTLGIECSFYIIATACLAIDRFSLFRPIIFSIALLSTLFWVSFYFLHHAYPSFDTLRQNRFFALILMRHAPFFAIGVIISGLGVARKISRTDQIAGGIFAIGCLFEIWAANDEINSITRQDLTAATPLVIWLLAMGAMVYSVVKTSPEKPRSFTRFLGLTTYPLYLVHSQLGIAGTLTAVWLGLPPAFGLLLGVFVSMSLASLIAFSYGPEPWLRNVLRDLFVRIRLIRLDERTQRNTVTS